MGSTGRPQPLSPPHPFKKILKKIIYKKEGNNFKFEINCSTIWTFLNKVLILLKDLQFFVG